MNNGGLMSENVNGNRQRNISLALTLALHAMNHAMFNMLTPLGPTLTRYFGFTALSKIGFGIAIYLAFYGFCQIPVGFLSDRMPRKLLLGAGAILTGFAIAGAALVPTYNVFLVAMAFAGLGASAYHPVNASYVSDLFSKSRGSALGISGIGATFGLFFGPIIGGALCEAVGWRVTFVVFSCASVMTGIIFILFAVEPEREIKKGAAGASGWSGPVIAFLAVAATVFTLREFAGWGGYFLIPVFAETIYKYPISYAGFIGGLQSFGGFVAQPLGGWLSDRFGRRRLMIIFLFFCAVFMMLIPFAGKTFFIPAVFMYGIFYTATVPMIDAIIADRTPASIRGGVFGIFMAAGIGISAISPMLQAGIIDASGSSFRGFATCYIMLGTFVILSMIVLIFFRNAEARSE